MAPGELKSFANGQKMFCAFAISFDFTKNQVGNGLLHDIFKSNDSMLYDLGTSSLGEVSLHLNW